MNYKQYSVNDEMNSIEVIELLVVCYSPYDRASRHMVFLNIYVTM